MKSIPKLILVGGAVSLLVTTTGTSVGLAATPAPPTSNCVTKYLAPSFPFAITQGPGGEYYGAGNQIVRVKPHGDQVYFTLPNPDQAYVNWLSRQGARIWFGDGGSGQIGYLRPNGKFTEWQTPAPVSGAAGITFLGKDVWFTSPGTNQVGMFDPTSGQFTMYDVPTPDSWPLGITIGPDGNIWFIERTAHQVGEVTPDGQFTEYPLAKHAFPNRIVTFDGAVWFTELKAGRIGRITPDGTLTETAVDGGPVGITVEGGSVYVAMYEGNQIARLNPTTGAVAKTWDVPKQPLQAAAGAGGSVWTTAKKYVAKVSLHCAAT